MTAPFAVGPPFNTPTPVSYPGATFLPNVNPDALPFTTPGAGVFVYARDGALVWRGPDGSEQGVVGSLTPQMFGAVGDGVADDTAALTAAHAAWSALATAGIAARLVFPPGIYRYDVSPNWAVQDAEVDFVGEVRLRYFGVGNAVILDGGAAGGGVFNCKFGVSGRVLVECPSTAENAIYARAFHAGLVRAKVLGAGAAFSGLRTEWAVCSTFDIICSVNHEGWYQNAKPENGIYLTVRGGSKTAYCTFPTPIVEGCNVGIYLHHTLGNNFFGGTSEGNTLYGVYAATSSDLDKFFGVDFEANNGEDVYCQGTGITFTQCDSDSRVAIGASAQHCEIAGGNFESILLDAGSIANVAHDLKYNRLGAGTLVIAGTDNRAHHLTNATNDDPYITENTGTATITAAVTTVVVNHGLGITPTLPDIGVTPTNNLGLATRFWISNPTSTQFTINVDVAPGAGTATFAWTATVQ